jgi:predicted hydrocarbon binding protein
MKEEQYEFKWKDIGNITNGRPNLGTTTHVATYRLMQYTLRSTLSKTYGSEATQEIFYKAGELAGKEFCKHMLDTSLELIPFITLLQNKLLDLKIGILKVEHSNLEQMHFTFVIEEDLDCSGLPFTNETTCDYDEGFFAGILFTYSGIEFSVKEIDCWSSGERVCRFDIRKKQ